MMQEKDEKMECTLDIIDFKNIGEANYGSKFTNLSILATSGINVPYAICISSNLLEKEIEKYLVNKDEFQNYFKDIESTSGCYLLDTYPKIERMISGFHFSNEGKEFILNNVVEKFADYNVIDFAIRSSAIHEDDKLNSFAGIYETLLNVTFYTIIKSLEFVVVSYYNYRSMIARIRTGNYSYKIEMNIIIQKMVKSKISGVAFSKSAISKGQPIVEWIYGLGELLVSGEKEANVYYPNQYVESEHNELLDEVIVNIKKIRNILGYEVDSEWCYDGEQLYFVQARPITDIFAIGQPIDNIFEIDRLYFDTNLEFENKLLQCKNIYRGYTSKRSPKYMLAKKNNIQTGKGYVIHFNFKGLKKNKAKIEEICTGNHFEKFDIDVDDTIRQNIIRKNFLWDYLKTIFGGYDESLKHTMIIREFISGEMGCISHLLENGNVYVEYSTDGLLTMNRGLAKCESLIINKDKTDTYQFSGEYWNDIEYFTRILNNPSIMIEWVICNNQAYFIDFSEEFRIAEMSIDDCSNRVIMPGNVSGPVFYMKNTDIMNKLSLSPGVSVHDINEKIVHNPKFEEILDEIKQLDDKPILFSEKPYAVLSLFFDDVKGFVFKSSSLLCHLSILIREAKIPTVVCKENFDTYACNCREVMIVNGDVKPI